MNAGDRWKIQRAGFRIFRKRPPVTDGMPWSIWECKGGGWSKHSEQATHAEHERAWKMLLTDPKCIGE